MDKQTTALLGCIVALLAIIMASLLTNNTRNHLVHVEHTLNISASATLQHVTNLLALGDAETYEEGRRHAREYLKSSLIKGGIPQDSVLWHYFEWKEKQKASTLLWTGVNVLVWLNDTEIPSHKVRVFGAHYDTFFWGKNSTAGACSLAGASLLLETAINIYTYQQEQKRLNPEFEEVPYLFIFFDHHEPGALGAKSLIDQLHHEDIAYFIGVSSVGFQGSSPLLQTFPYDHMQQSVYTPEWLASSLLQAGISNNVPIKIGGTTKIRSLLYQAYRYHWHAVSHLGEDGPFAWQGVPSALLTDYDDIFEPSPHYHKATDQAWTLDERKVKEFAKVLASFVVVTSRDAKFEIQSTSEHSATFLQQILAPSPIISPCFSFVFNGLHQYLAVGFFIVGFVEIASLSFVIISVVIFSSVYQYQQVYSSENSESKAAVESESESSSDYDFFKPPTESPPPEIDQGYWQGHKILVVHMLLMSMAVIVDTVFAFQMLSLGFLALSTIHFSKFYINIITGFICSILCVNLLCRDVIVMSKFGVRTHDVRELRLGALLLIYLLHSVLLLVYGYDYKRKKAKLKHA